MERSWTLFIKTANTLGKPAKLILNEAGIDASMCKNWTKGELPTAEKQTELVNILNRGVIPEKKVSITDIFENATAPAAPVVEEALPEEESLPENGSVEETVPANVEDTKENEEAVEEEEAEEIEDTEDTEEAEEISEAESIPEDVVKEQTFSEFDAMPKPVETVETVETVPDKPKRHRRTKAEMAAETAQTKETVQKENKTMAKTTPTTKTKKVTAEEVSGKIKESADTLNKLFADFVATVPVYTEKQQELIKAILPLKDKDLDMLISMAVRLK